MYAFIPWNPEALPQWEKALDLLRSGEPPSRVIRATGIKPSTFFRRLARERELLEYRPRSVT